MFDISVNLRLLREDRGLSQLKLARLAGVTGNVVHKIEAGKCDPKVSTIIKLMRVLRCSPDDLFIQPRCEQSDIWAGWGYRKYCEVSEQ